MKRKSSKLSLRFVIQLVIVVLIFTLAALHIRFGIEKVAPIDAYCPFGAVESFFTLIFKGEFLKRIFSSSFVLLGIFFIASFLLGKVFCGYICPLGAIQEWLRPLGKKLGFRQDYELPEKADKYLRYAKYLVLVVIVYYSFYLGDLVFRHYGPYNALMHLGHEIDEKPVGYIALLIIIVISMFSKNFWCRYLCPLGAFFGIIRKISFLKIDRNVETCIDCGMCDKSCPAGLSIMTASSLKKADCISCGKCVDVCPKNSLDFVLFGKKISGKIFSILVLLLVVLPLIVMPYTPIWKTKPESNIVNSRGEINTADIRGSNTLKYIVEVTKVPLQEFKDKLNLPSDVDVTIKIKLIGTKYNLKNADGEFLQTEDFRQVIDDYISKKPTRAVGSCPFGEIDCEFPGKCGRYVDWDEDKVCDYSQQ